MPAYPTITTLGDLLIGGASGVEARLPGNTSTGLKFLRSVGDGSNAAGPSWEELDIASVSGLTAALDGKETIGAAATLAATLGDLATLDAVTKSLVSDLETITATSTASAIPKADGSGKIANGWLNTGSGNGIDADLLDGSHASAFARLSEANTFTERLLIPDGSLGAPALTFASTDGGTNMGLYLAGTTMQFVYNSIASMQVTRFGTLLTYAIQLQSNGSAAAPVFGFNGDSNTGMYRVAEDVLGFSTGGAERVRISSAGLDVSADTLRVSTSKTPASASASGSAGDICWDSSYIYVCTATNTWKRAALTSW